MNQIGLVFEGGGGKGAYQIGVWKYLREKGLDRYVGGVSGTSVGALNAVLFAAGDYSTAERIWKNISRDQILSSKAFTNTLAGAGSQAALANIWRTVSRSAIERAVNQAMGQALFTRDGLLRIMHRYVDMRKVQRAGIPCFATCLEISGVLPAVKRFELRCYAKITSRRSCWLPLRFRLSLTRYCSTENSTVTVELSCWAETIPPSGRCMIGGSVFSLSYI